MTAPIQEGYAAPEDYLNREVSWIRFNARVLHEALDERTPLLERLKFLAIFETNLDEFFMVRVAVIKRQLETGVVSLTPDGLTRQQQLNLIYDELKPIVDDHHECFEQILRPALAKEAGIHILDYLELSTDQQTELENYFHEQIFPVLTPLAVDPGHPFPYISSLSLSLIVIVEDPDTQSDQFARVKVPGVLPRFVPLADGKTFVTLEQVIAHNLGSLFVGMTIKECFPFRLTRDADMEIQEDEADDLLSAIEGELRKRRFGSVVRMEISSQASPQVRERLQEELGLADQNVYVIDGLLNLGHLISFLSLELPHLKDQPWSIPTHPRLRIPANSSQENPDIFALIREKDILLHHPYDSFNTSVLAFMQQAATDPHVLTIKQTLYRTSGDSPVVDALIEAAENGKQVAAVVELKARFDEENNIWWAKKLEKAGVHVTYGLTGLKIHSKIAAVVRREGHVLRRYVHIGTGNYNPKTARLYTDLGILSCDPTLAADVSDIFNYLTGYSRQRHFRSLLVSPITLRQRMMELIDREIDHHRHHQQGRIIAKMNSLVDPQIIAKLYEAGRIGVSMDLIVRGMCCLKPGVPGLSESIRVVSIVGRFLEHSRVFYFHNGGTPEVFIGSADWMTRNLDRRVEVITPVLQPDLSQELQQLLHLMLGDNRQAWDLDVNGQYHQRYPQTGEESRSTHVLLMEYANQGSRPYGPCH